MVINQKGSVTLAIYYLQLIQEHDLIGYHAWTHYDNASLESNIIPLFPSTFKTIKCTTILFGEYPGLQQFPWVAHLKIM